MASVTNTVDAVASVMSTVVSVTPSVCSVTSSVVTVTPSVVTVCSVASSVVVKTSVTKSANIIDRKYQQRNVANTRPCPDLLAHSSPCTVEAHIHVIATPDAY